MIIYFRIIKIEKLEKTLVLLFFLCRRGASNACKINTFCYSIVSCNNNTFLLISDIFQQKKFDKNKVLIDREL